MGADLAEELRVRVRSLLGSRDRSDRRQRRRGQIFILRILEVGRRGQIFTLRILGVSKKRPVSHPRLSALVTDTKDAAGIARAYLEHHYTGLPVPAEGSYAGPRTANSPASAG